MTDAKSANGKTAIVTGAGTGIGKATAIALLAEGWNTVFVGRRKNLLDEAVAEAETTGAVGARALAVACDVTKPDKVDEMFETIAEAFGRVDLLFNNAGIGFKTATIDEVPVEVWTRSGRGQPDGFLPCRARGLCRDAQAAADGWPHHQQWLDLGAYADGQARYPIRRPSTPSPASPRRWRSTGGRSTSPAARSISAMRRPASRRLMSVCRRRMVR